MQKNKIITFLTIPFKISPSYFFIKLFQLAFNGFYPLLEVLAFTFLTNSVIELKKGGEIKEQIGLAVILFFSLIFLNYFFDIFIRRISYKQVKKINLALETKFISKISRLEYYYIENAELYDKINLIKKEILKDFIQKHNKLLSIFRILFQLMSIIIIVFSVMGIKGLIILAGITAVILISDYNGKRNYTQKKEDAFLDRMCDYYSDILCQGEFGQEKLIYNYGDAINCKYRKLNKTLIQHEKKTKLKNILRLESSSFLTLFIFVYFIIELSLKVKSNLISIGFLIASIKQLSSFLNIIRWDLYSVLEIKSELSNYLKDFNEFESFNEIDNNESIFIDKIKSLNIKNLNFIYPFSKKVILHDINYDFKLNKSYAIVGENGCGKTTFIKLLLGLYKNYSGEILLNDKELKTLTPKSISENFAVVFQDYGRYYLNLIENIQIGNPKASISEIQNAISLFSLKGIDTESVLRKGDDKSVNLSGGQWQNIAMARNFISNAKIVIFDEPTAALSPSQESKIYTFLKDIIKNKTAVFISHRLGITPLVDKIIVLKDGAIAETGSHNDLIQKKGIYAQMYNTQKELYS